MAEDTSVVQLTAENARTAMSVLLERERILRSLEKALGVTVPRWEAPVA